MTLTRLAGAAVDCAAAQAAKAKWGQATPTRKHVQRPAPAPPLDPVLPPAYR